MKCSKVRKRLVLFLDGELVSSDAEDVREHLGRCDGCRREAELLTDTLNLAVGRARERKLPPSPEDPVGMFWRKERQESQRKGTSRARDFASALSLRRVLGYGIATVLVVGLAGLVLREVVRNDKSQPVVSSSESEGGKTEPPPIPTRDGENELSQIEKRLAELEASVRRLNAVASTSGRLEGSDMQEIYAAIGLAAANNYKHVLKMNDLAMERYTRVASEFPDTSAGQAARELLLRPN
jgi:hypothetical protein